MCLCVIIEDGRGGDVVYILLTVHPWKWFWRTFTRSRCKGIML